MRIGSGPALAGSSESGQRSLAPVFEPIILVPLGERFLAEGELIASKSGISSRHCPVSAARPRDPLQDRKRKHGGCREQRAVTAFIVPFS